MATRKVPAEVAEKVIGRLRELDYVNDAAFAEGLTANRIKHSGRGRARIRQELLQKGVDREVIDTALEGVDPEQEWHSAHAVAAKRMRGMRDLAPHVILRRLQGALARRGFSPDIVLTVSREALEDAEGDQEFS